MRRIAFAVAPITAAIALIAASAASARAEDGCDKFAWSLAPERAAFAKVQSEPAADVVKLDMTAALAVRLKLHADNELKFVMPPERKPKAEHWSGAVVQFSAPPRAGIYQVTLSDEAWIDVVQNGRYAREVGHSGRGDCPGVRKSLRLELAAEPFALQLSGAQVEAITVSVNAAKTE
jgi:hypothetical protein